MVTGEMITAARVRLGESQAQFAKRFGVNQSTLHRWEAKGPPTGGTALRVIEQVIAQISEAEAA